MQSVSQAYNPYPGERWSNIRLIFELTDVDAAEDATATATSEAEISKPEQAHNRVVEMERKLATLEQDYFLLDGSFLLPDETDNGEVGWWSGDVSDSNGMFAVPQVLEFTFTEPQSSIGFTIAFDEKANQYASNFKIEIFDATDQLVAEDIITDNTLSRYISETPVDGYQRVKIIFTKTHLPLRRIRVSEVVFGIIQTFDDNNATDLRLLYELSPTMENLPSNELTVTIENTDRKYNMINPKGIYKYLQEGQGLDAKISIGGEYVDMGTFYYTKSSAEDASMTAQIVAHDQLYGLDRGLYRKGREGTGTVEDIVNEIIADSGVALTISIPANIASRVIGWNIPIASHREALRMVTQAAMCSCFIDRTGVLVFSELLEGEPVDTLNNDNLYTPAKVEVDKEYTNAVEVSYYQLRDPDLTDDEIYKATAIINGTKTLWIAHEPARGISASVNTGTINSVEHYLYASKLTITAPAEVVITLTGRQLDLLEGFYRTGNGGNVKRVENQLISYATAPDFADWCLAIEQKRLTYKLQERGNPAREIGDTVKIYDAYSENRNAIITKQEYLFDGTLRANTEAWGGGI